MASHPEGRRVGGEAPPALPALPAHDLVRPLLVELCMNYNERVAEDRVVDEADSERGAIRSSASRYSTKAALVRPRLSVIEKLVAARRASLLVLCARDAAKKQPYLDSNMHNYRSYIRCNRRLRHAMEGRGVGGKGSAVTVAEG